MALIKFYIMFILNQIYKSDAFYIFFIYNFNFKSIKFFKEFFFLNQKLLNFLPVYSYTI